MKLLTRRSKLNLDRSKRYLLACSGGPDSMALFGMLIEENYNFEVAFVNYKTRDNSDLEQKLIEGFSRKHNINCHILEKKCSSAGNFENNARKIRYNFFFDIVKTQQNLDGILVAHNADDLIETYIIQNKRKVLTEVYGLTFVSKMQEINIYRPLLRYEKKFLESYCVKNHIPYSIDATNFDEKYLRNSIRNKIISKLNREEKNEILNLVSKKNVELNKIYKKFETNIVGKEATVFTKNIEVLQRFLFYFVKKQGNFLLTANYKNLLDDIVNDRFNTLYNFKKFFIIFDSEGLLFMRKDPNSINYEYSKEYFNKNVGECRFDEQIVIRPLIKFDSFKLNGHTKKTNRFFIDCKMPLRYRYLWPCVTVDKANIIYVPRYRKNYKITKQSKLLFFAKTLQNLNIF